MKLLSLKNRFRFKAIAMAIASSLAVISVGSAKAESQQGFHCDTNSTVPTTIYNNAEGISEPWIK
ncbi:MAG: hypothetical protein AAGE96_26735, partial [Cyanobacteria bacterium P01_G01_bin.19]